MCTLKTERHCTRRLKHQRPVIKWALIPQVRILLQTKCHRLFIMWSNFHNFTNPTLHFPVTFPFIKNRRGSYAPGKRSEIETITFYELNISFPGVSDGKESAFSVGDTGLTSRLGRSPGEGNGYPLQDSCLENSMDREAWQATICGVTKSWMWLTLSLFTFLLI